MINRITVKDIIGIGGNGNLVNYNTMNKSFTEPNFSEGIIEFRIDGNEVSIYGTPEGLRWLAQKCLVLVDAGKKNHLHLDDYHVLTKESKPATLANFPS